MTNKKAHSAFFMNKTYNLLVNNMFDIIKSYFSKEEYYIILTKNYLYIKNYTKIINIEENEILLEINSKIYKIKGDNKKNKRWWMFRDCI